MSMKEENHIARYPVLTLEKALSILQLMASRANAHEGMRISDIDEQLKLGKSTIHRILDTLAEYDFVTKSESSGRYSLGWGLFSIGSAVARQLSPETLDYAALKELEGRHQETVNFGIRVNAEVMVVYQSEPDITLKANRYVGQREPLHATAMGKLLICEEDGKSLSRLMDEIDFVKYTDKTVVSRKQLLEELQKVRRRGFAFDNEEFCLGLTCLAFPVRDHSGRIAGSVSISGPTVRFGQERMMELREDMQKASLSLSKQLGWRPDT